MVETAPSIVGLVLAGGKSLRMAGPDKFLLSLDGVTLVERVVARMSPQVDQMVLSANGDPLRLPSGLPIVADAPPSRGPLSGLLAGLRWAKRQCGPDALVLSCPADVPFLPRDLALQLEAGRSKAGVAVAVAASRGRTHYAIGLWPVDLVDALAAWLGDGQSAVHGFLASVAMTTVMFEAAYDPFFNINTPDDLTLAATMSEALGG